MSFSRFESLPTYDLLSVSFVSFRWFSYLLAVSLMSTVDFIINITDSKCESVFIYSEKHVSRTKAPLGKRKGNGQDGYYVGYYIGRRTAPFLKTAIGGFARKTASKLQPTFRNRLKRKSQFRATSSPKASLMLIDLFLSSACDIAFDSSSDFRGAFYRVV